MYWQPVSLILWWWWARWFAHVWVIRYLQEQDRHIWDIAWTSMWACIWSCLACDIPMDEVQEIASEITYSQLIDFDISTWLIHGKKLTTLLKKVFGERTIDQTKIPLTICATRLVWGTAYYFTSGPIRQALRASISLPWVFSPAEIDGEEFVDGGLTHNLPIDQARSNSIIAVSVMKDLSTPIRRAESIWWVSLPKNRLSLNYEILSRSLSIMLTAQENHLLEATKKSYTLIRPKITSIGLFDIKKVNQAIEVWYAEAKKVLTKA